MCSGCCLTRYDEKATCSEPLIVSFHDDTQKFSLQGYDDDLGELHSSQNNKALVKCNGNEKTFHMLHVSGQDRNIPIEIEKMCHI